MNIFDDTTYQILMKFLDKKIKDAEGEIASTGTLSEEHAIPLLLKTQFNHIMHLEAEITEIRRLVEKLETRFGRVGNSLILGFTIIGFLIIIFGFLR